MISHKSKSKNSNALLQQWVKGYKLMTECYRQGNLSLFSIFDCCTISYEIFRKYNNTPVNISSIIIIIVAHQQYVFSVMLPVLQSSSLCIKESKKVFNKTQRDQHQSLQSFSLLLKYYSLIFHFSFCLACRQTSYNFPHDWLDHVDMIVVVVLFLSYILYYQVSGLTDSHNHSK